MHTSKPNSYDQYIVKINNVLIQSLHTDQNFTVYDKNIVKFYFVDQYFSMMTDDRVNQLFKCNEGILNSFIGLFSFRF